MSESGSLDDGHFLDTLVARWEAARAAGTVLPTEEQLCADRPHLLPRLRTAILKLQQADAFLDPSALTVTQASPPPTAPPMPQTVGPYRILELLGEGGMGTVYKAEQRAPLKRTVAIKVVKAGFDTAEVLARFQAEHQALARLDHPNIARVFDAGTTELGRPYFVMEYLPGQPITRFCDDNKLSIRQRLELFHQACDAITHAHIKAIVHRDIKASNVLAFMQDGKPMVKVIDFGIAKALTGDRLTDLTFNTGRGVVVGTYDSMSPEQAAGSLDIDTRTDVYSMGVLLYELLTGAKPFDVRTFAEAADGEIRRIIREVDPPRPSTRFSSLGENVGRIALVRQSKVDQLARDLKSDLGWIPLKAMRKERRDRYVSPLQMSEDIDNYLHGRPLIAGPESQIYKLRKFVSRNARPLGLAVAGILFVVGGTFFYIHGINTERAKTQLALEHESQQRQAAEEQKQIAQTNLIAASLKQAELSAQRGKWEASLNAYDAARDAGCTDLQRLLVGRVLSLQNLGRSADARHEMDDALRVHGELADDPIVMVRHGELLWADDPAEGEKLLRAAIQRPLPTSELAFARGLLANSIPEAITRFKQCVDADPFRQDAIGMIAILSTEIGQWSDADDYTLAWERMFPDDPTARITRSLQFALHGDEANARRNLAEAAGVLGPKIHADLENSIGLLVKLRNDPLGEEAVDISNSTSIVIQLISKSANPSGRSNLLFPKVMIQAKADILSGIFLQTIGANLRAAQAYASIEKSLPVGLIGVLRGGSLFSADHFEESGDEFAKAASLPSPVDVSGYAHVMAAGAYVQAHTVNHDSAAKMREDSRIPSHLLQAAELGALGPGTGANCFYWKTSASIIVGWRKTNDARTLLDLWRKIAPDNPVVAVWEIENEYLAGNYGTAVRFFDSLDQRFPKYDFSAIQDVRAACMKAINDRNTDPPPIEAKVLDLNYTVPLRPTTKPTTKP